MGTALQDKGDLEAAIDSYKQALKIKPDYAEAYYNIGAVQQDKGDLEAAIDSYKQALKIKPDFAEVYSNMGIVLQEVVFTKPSPELQQIIISLIDKKTYVRPVDIAAAAISLLKFDPLIQGVLERHSSGKLEQSLHKSVAELSEVPLFLKFMSVCQLPDLELEDVLTNIRSTLLLSITDVPGSAETLSFQSALALQCFTNEYIYNQTDSESLALKTLEISVSEILSQGRQPRATSVLCLASYKSLYEYSWYHMLSLPVELYEIGKRQISEPIEEKRLLSEIPILREITGRVSSKVREQYEQHPFPRWVNLALRFDPTSVSRIAKEEKWRIFDHKINDVEEPAVLVAGCGTGQHSISAASTFKNSHVLAVDLSLRSLAYAKRKTNELGFQNIEYMHADILDLGKLDRQFDIIESAGVLHHMEEPMAGWRVLTDCLKPGGVMKVGLYSELARRDIVRIRAEIDQLDVGVSDLAMKSFRSDLIGSELEHYRKVVNFSDCYSLSNFRDLLFHVQEHRFTLPQIKDCLAELGLEFCGFAAKSIVQDFKLRHQGADDPYDIEKWQSYEETNPNTFAGMYQFWCQKVE
jgi:2-polyprenyl-3-methyl-5-hydroxy-6-metoxy-1,4-benzoquinol methylase/tetratricopeptide (TPR) repeat protein